MTEHVEKHNRMQRIKFGMHLFKRVSFKSVWTQIQDARRREESGMKLDREQHGIERGYCVCMCVYLDGGVVKQNYLEGVVGECLYGVFGRVSLNDDLKNRLVNKQSGSKQGSERRQKSPFICEQESLFFLGRDRERNSLMLMRGWRLFR